MSQFKKLTAIIIAFAMVIGILSATVSFAAECAISDNVIDITDKFVYEKKNIGSAQVTDIRISGADVESAEEDGTTINIVLDGYTDTDATISVEFGTVLSKNMNMSGHKTTINLENGEATAVMTLKGQYFSMSSLSGTVTYTLNFSLGVVSGEPPTRITESYSASTYSGVSVEFDLKEYFHNAKEYYLADGEDKILLDSRIYTFRSFEDGTYTLEFYASNDNGFCPDSVTVTVEVIAIESGAWLGITTSNGSVNYVKFTDEDGNNIDGIQAYLDDKSIMANLPRTVDVNGKITATFDLTQSEGLPKLSTSNSFNGTNDTKVYRTTLSRGSGKATMYLYNANPKAVSNVYTTYTINYAIENQIPTLASLQEGTESAEIFAGEEYVIDLAPLFTDADGDELTYSVEINGAAPVTAEANYSFVPTLGGIYELEFFASDFMATSEQSYKVVLNVKNSEQTYNMSVSLPDDSAPQFYITNGYDTNGKDITEDTLTFTADESVGGYITYNVAVPTNISEISVRDPQYGGMAFLSSNSGSVTLGKVQTEITDMGGRTLQGAVSVAYGTHQAIGVDGKFLLVSGSEYKFTATPSDSSSYNSAAKTITLSNDINIVTVEVTYKNPKTITTTTGAQVKLFKYASNYFVHTVYEPLATVENTDGTSTHYFTAQGDLSYRVMMDGKITKAGFLTKNSATVLYTDDDALPSDRIDYTTAGSNASSVADDSLLLNINRRNHLALYLGESKTIKAYRAWEIINNYMNHIIEPDFHFNIISGDDVVEISPYENQPMTNSSGNWRTLTAIGEGMAVIEVTYDAIFIEGGSYGGFYGATDQARTGLFVVTVGENVPSVDFGIECKTSAGSIVYSDSNAKKWDSEFDTLYFIGDNGEIRLSPTLEDGNITEVAVSGDKGESYSILQANEGVYTASIVSGNNIIRVTTDKGIAYQIVRGDKIELKVKNLTNPDNPIAAGDKVSLKLVGVHTPIPKIAGTFNPGYSENNDGKSEVHLNYTFGETTIVSQGRQYDFSLNGTAIEFIVPSDTEETEFKITDGYIGVGVIGVTGFSDGGDSHRNIPDGGSGTRGSKTTFTTRSLLPDITVNIGMLPSDNTAPFVRETAPKTASVTNGGTYAISMSKIFIDRDDDKLTYTAKIDDGEAYEIDNYYTFSPDETGIYTIVFVANDGKVNSVEHILELTVKEKSGSPSSGSSLDFDITGDEVKGYINISFIDKGKRVEGEKNLEYPEALGVIISSKKVPFAENDTIADVTIRLLDAMGYSYEYSGTTKSGFYLSAIGNFTVKGVEYDSFGEFDAGSGSGWMVTLNNKFIEYGASDFKVKNGDTVKWQYTCQLGEDIGDPFYSGKESSKTNTESESTFFTEDTFSDVNKDDWHYEAVKYVYEKNLMQGTGKGFEPDSNMTRAMLVTVLYRLANPDEKTATVTFNDISADNWFFDAVSWATENNIVNGTGNGEFLPNENITREQMALIIYRFVKMQGINTDEFSNLENFADAEDISSWAIDGMKWANSVNLINGTSETSLSPKNTATRAQVATILMRLCELPLEQGE